MMLRVNTEDMHLRGNRMSRAIKLLRSAAIAIAAVLVFSSAQEVFAQGGIKGKVRNQRGNGIASAEVSIRQDGKVVKTARSNSKGEFNVTGIRPGKYNISFEAEGYSPGVLYNVEITDKVRDLGDRLILAVDRGTLALIRGSVFFREGTSVTGARVELEIVNSDGSTKRVDSGYTNSSGEIVFRRQPTTAKYRITARYKNISDSKEIEVDGPAMYSTAITLELSRNDR